MKVQKAELLATLSGVTSDIAAFWFTAAFAIPLFTADSALRELATLLADIILGMLFLGVSYFLTVSVKELAL